MSQCLLNKKCNSYNMPFKNKNLAEVTKQADVVVAAIGKPCFVTADMVKKRCNSN